LRAAGSLARIDVGGLAFYALLLVTPIERFWFGHCDWPLGEITLVGGVRGLRRVGFDQMDPAVVRAELEASLGAPVVLEALPSPTRSPAEAAPLREAIDDLTRYLNAGRRAPRCRLDLGGQTEFRRRVLVGCRRVPFGSTISYGSLARKVNRPGAARAVGSAMAHNPVPVFVPCHRVVASGGRLGGFTGGLAVKRLLLELEGAEPLRS
jgi:methylated-DNA-[protein]-cysteine S-methyltransferase